MLLGMLSSSVVGCECPSRSESARAPTTTAPDAGGGVWQELAFEATAKRKEAQHALLLANGDGPLLIALHGRGEAGRGLTEGARGWRDDYELERARTRALAPPLTKADFHGFVKQARLVALNASLRANPYEGLAVACPYTPALSDRSVDGAKPFASFVIDELIGRARAALGVAPPPPADVRARTGIDGVSMGGRLALLVGLSHPETFGAVGALQPAISKGEALWLSQLAARAAAVGTQAIRLVTSKSDPFREAVETLSQQLDRDGVAHQLVVTPGPHDYIWNRGPGSYELLLWHERVLRGLPPP
jgi:hypothetical protein